MNPILLKVSLRCAIITILFLSILTEKTGFASTNDIPFVLASMNGNFVDGYNWPTGNLVTMTIDDPSNGPGIDYTDTALSIPYGQPGLSTLAFFDLTQRINLKPGFIINLSDGNTAKTLIAANFYVTSIDIATNTISGTATPGTTVTVCPDAGFVGDCRNAITDITGHWTALPYSPNTFILQPGVNGWAIEKDIDGDQTYYRWNVPYSLYLPYIKS